MGVYMVPVDELIDAITNTLDDVEGDFSSATLRLALDRCKKYEHTSDVKRKRCSGCVWYRPSSSCCPVRKATHGNLYACESYDPKGGE